MFAELSWTPSIMIQAEDRAHRIGQNSECVDVRYLYGRDTLDEYIFSKLSEKMTIVSTTLDNVKVDMGLKDNESEDKDSDSELSDKERTETNEDLETVSTEIDLYDVNGHVHPMKRNKKETQTNNDELIKNKTYVVNA